MNGREWKEKCWIKEKERAEVKKKIGRRAEIKIEKETEGKTFRTSPKLSRQNTLISQSADSTLSPLALKTA